MGTDTAVEARDLTLTTGQHYQVMVLAMDESGGCAMVTGDFTVDTTPPTEGSMCVGDGTHSKMVGILNSFSIIDNIKHNHL